MKRIDKIKSLKNLKLSSSLLLFLGLALIIVSIINKDALISTILLLLGISLFIVWFLSYFSLDEKLKKMLKK
jgi:hypothetical protein